MVVTRKVHGVWYAWFRTDEGLDVGTKPGRTKHDAIEAHKRLMEESWKDYIFHARQQRRENDRRHRKGKPRIFR